MLREKIICVGAALLLGCILSFLHIPAGWLLGGLLTGIGYGLFLKRLAFEGWPFRIVLALVGVNVGFMMQTEIFQLIGQYFVPLLLSLTLTLAAGVGIGWLMNHWTNLDPLTAYFCCVPGGASEVIALSGDYGADNRVVAAFHTARITFFVLTIPFLAGFFYPDELQAKSAGFALEGMELSVLAGLLSAILVTILLFRLWKVPAGTLFYGIFTGFIISEWVMSGSASLPSYIGGIGQALIGVMVGIRFDRPTFFKLKDIGKPSAILLAIYFLFSLTLAFIFEWMTGLPYMTSLLSTVPAGAAEMSSTAMALHLEPTLVASLHIIRVIALFLFLPFFINLIKRAAEQGN
ncbi:AbrB family transcriptional regulator [Alteribacillus sp. YIM 98480]|uniref:AbrB family transcriptional regulator n=1 Tax=Alteribacillus sp. YIM 98480 TaxID=2606599 RepID=UPI00131B3563|nr:AbrB family transcriptional regulator [Alteribacillus sp. YIM 98480]